VIAKATAPDHNAIRNASRAECGWADEIGETTEKCGYNPSKDWFKGKSAGNYGIHIVFTIKSFRFTGKPLRRSFLSGNGL